MGVGAADELAARGPSRDRDRELQRWAKRASLPELMYVLRHDPETLGKTVEVTLTKEALSRTSDVRPDLRRRLRVRLAVADRGQAKKMLGQLGSDVEMLGARARASAYRVAVLLPRQGAYAGYAQSLMDGVNAGFAHHNASHPLKIVAERWPTGDDRPAQAAAMLDSASRVSAVAIGELLSVPTLALGTGARMLGLPLISPTATDENVGATGPTVFQVGPSAFQRGVALARSVLDGPLRIGVLVSSDHEQSPFPQGFIAQAERMGSELIWRDVYAPGSLDFTSLVKRMGLEQIQVLLWDGDAREATALLREIKQQQLHLRFCGAETLAPENFHRASLPLLEETRYVADDWVLADELRAPLDSLIRASGEPEVNALHLRGFLAAHLVAAVVRGRALCPEEIAASLETRVTGDEYLRERGFLDWTVEGASLPVYEVREGKPVALLAR